MRCRLLPALLLGSQLLGSLWILPARAEVVLAGINPPLLTAVEEQLSLWGQPCDMNRWVVRYQFSLVETEVRDALQTFGYYSPVVTSELAWRTSPKECWQAVLKVNPGAPVVIRNMNFAVLPETPLFNNLLAEGMRSGDQFDHQQYEDLKSSLERMATEKGFFDAQFSERQVVIDVDQQAADISLQWAVGQRYAFGPVSYEGGGLNDQLIDRFLPFKLNDPYDAVQLGEFYRALLGSDYFADVTIDADIDAAVDHQVPVRVTLQPIKPTETRLGLGYSTDIGAKASVGHTNKRINHRGHRLEASLSVAERESEVGGFYRMPDSDYAGGWTSLYAGLKKTNTDTSESTTTKVGVRQLVLLPGNWIMTRFVEVVNDDFVVGLTENTTTNYVPGVSFNHTRSDLSRRPRSGYRIGLGVSGASRSLASDSDFVNVFANGKSILPLWSRGRLITRGQVAAVVSDDFDALPPGNRYFSGGDNKVRGFDFESLGPADASGAVIGGNRLLEASVEIDHRFAENWAVAAFVDAGSASLDHFSTTFSSAVGVGVRWYSPIGPVQVDIAQPTQGGGLHLHINLGPEL
jgi:translocation and assembly module TamA